MRVARPLGLWSLRPFVILGAALALLLGAGAAHAAVPRPPDPLAAARYLAAQRAGYGSPRAAAAAAGRAERQAAVLRSGARRSSSLSTDAVGGTWSALGPAPIRESYYGGTASGRVDAIAMTPNGGEIVIGSAGGGVWSSTDGGVQWVTHTDQLSSGLAIGALAVAPSSPQTIYAGTGEGNNCGDCFYGGGVLKSTDGGSSWAVENPAGMFTGVDFTAMAVDPSDAQHVFATTTIGVFVSTDGGASWSQPSGSGDFTDPASAVVLDPAHPSTVYVATPGVGVQESTDGGTNFATLGGGLPAPATVGVTALAIGTPSVAHPSADQTLYAAVALTGATDPGNGGDLSLYKSTDGGSTWASVTIPAYTNQSYAFGTGSADQAGYDNTLAVDPANPSHVIAGGIAAIESTDGGASWTNINGGNFFAGENVLHPDFHAAVFTPSGSVLLGSDGGVYRYVPGQGPAGVANLNAGLDIALAYQDLGVSGSGTTILAGMQGTGTAIYAGSRSWDDVLSGDGGYNAIDPLDTHLQFAETDGRLSVTGDNWSTSADITPPGEPGPATNFVPPIALRANALAPGAPTLYYGGADLWATTDPAAGAPSWTQLTSVGTGVSAIAVAPSDPNVLYVGFDDGTLEVSTNATSATPSFTVISPGVSEWITHISVSASNPSQVALSLSSSNTHSVQVPPMVMTGAVSLAGTPAATFVDQTGNLPVGVASNSVLFDAGDLLVATDVGVFSTPVGSLSGASTSWQAAGSGLPNVQVIGLTLDAAGNLYAATHGRGVWRLAGPTSPSAPVTLTPPSVWGTAAVSRTLAEIHGTWSGTPTSYRYQWLRCAPSGTCTPIAGATAATYTLTAADAGDTVEVQESATNASGTSLSATSAPTAAVLPAPPVAASGPSIAGAARVGVSLIEIGARWTQNPFVFVFQWYRCHGAACAAIAGATRATYLLVAADLGATITVTEAAANAGGLSAAVASAAVGPVQAAAPPPPPGPPSPAQVRHALRTVVATPAPRRSDAGAHASFTLQFSAPSAGHLTVAWSVKAAHGRALAIATLKLTVVRAGHLRLKLVLSARGRRLLAHSRRVWVQATGTFIVAGHRPVSVVRGFWLHR